MEGYQIAEYVWIDVDGNTRSKVKVLNNPVKNITELPIWNFDGSSTGQSKGNFSDVFLKPVRLYQDPFRKNNGIIVLCECYDDAKCTQQNHANKRKQLDDLFKKYEKEEPWCGIEQEFVIMDRKTKLPYKWLSKEDPGNGPQGPYYCSVGGQNSFGRFIIEEHMILCLEAGIHYHGSNAEVMPSQWEFQVGTADILKTSDDLWMARFLLHKLTEKYDLYVTFDPKPMLGDWNGNGGHTNFSTKAMREEGGIDYINQALKNLSETHLEDIKYYGEDNNLRMTGEHETSTLDKFSYGVGNRGSSVRISKQVHHDGKGFFEDRRPAGNLDPYSVLSRIMLSIYEHDMEKKQQIIKINLIIQNIFLFFKQIIFFFKQIIKIFFDNDLSFFFFQFFYFFQLVQFVFFLF